MLPRNELKIKYLAFSQVWQTDCSLSARENRTIYPKHSARAR